MGLGIAERLAGAGLPVVAFDLDGEARQAAEMAGAKTVGALADLPGQLSRPRVLWLMVPAGKTVDDILFDGPDALAPKLSSGDIVIDGGNSFYRDDIRRAAALAAVGLHHVDVGTSGGVQGLERGYCLMVGGDRSAFEVVEPLLSTLAPPGHGYEYCGGHGSGHFVKMVHNGIEYGMMQAYAEGFDIMRSRQAADVPSTTRYELPVADIAELWRRGSVVGSWLLDLTAAALAEDPKLSDIKGWVADSGEGRWTVAEAIAQDVPAPIITLSLLMRFVSRQEDSYAAKLLAALRNQFGGHAIRKERP